jgi:hypothetical protein
MLPPFAGYSQDSPAGTHMRHLSRFALLAALVGAAACDTITPTELEPTDPALTKSHSSGSGRTPHSIRLQKIGEYAGIGEGAAEITAFDPASERLFVVNGALGSVDVLDLQDPSAPALVATIGVAQFGGSANSVATHDGIVAVAVEASVKTDPGTVAFYRAATAELISSVGVGAQPDMVTFTPSGKYVLSANEGEPNDEYTVDPEGSISVIDVRNIDGPVVRTAGFAAFNGRIHQLRRKGVRIFGPNATVAQDLEPEYIAVSADGRTAYVTLQENNALAIVDIRQATIRAIEPLGFKNHLARGNGFDASDRDDAVNIRPWPVLGMYQPDAIAAYEVRGRTYLITANEGDTRDWAGFGEEARVNSLPLNPHIFTDRLCGGPCADNALLGRLTVTDRNGMNPRTGQFDRLYAFGGRSFSVWTDAGRLVWDSGDELERRTSALPMVAFNADNEDNQFDNRSDNKGPEAEGVVVGKLGRKTFAFIGLERVGGVIAFDVSRPSRPVFATYVNTRNGGSGDLGPEGLAFVSAADSPNGKPLLIVGNEVSGTTAIFEIELH